MSGVFPHAVFTIQIAFADAAQKEARQAELDRATAAVHACLETEAKQACDQ
jgi:hypothetical protein